MGSHEFVLSPFTWLTSDEEEEDGVSGHLEKVNREVSWGRERIRDP